MSKWRSWSSWSKAKISSSLVLLVVFIPLQKIGGSCFYVGTGKSVLLREIINLLHRKHGREKVARTAPTGIAGLNIGGSTIHSWAGIGLGKESADKLVDRLSTFKEMTWCSTAAWIIDESWCICLALLFIIEIFVPVSMLDGRLFDKLVSTFCPSFALTSRLLHRIT